jgi:hypothetical protein
MLMNKSYVFTDAEHAKRICTNQESGYGELLLSFSSGYVLTQHLVYSRIANVRISTQLNQFFSDFNSLLSRYLRGELRL